MDLTSYRRPLNVNPSTLGSESFPRFLNITIFSPSVAIIVIIATIATIPHDANCAVISVYCSGLRRSKRLFIPRMNNA